MATLFKIIFCVIYVIDDFLLLYTIFTFTHFRTKFHSDVMNSFSWSANICGRKLWYLLRGGQEKYFALGNEIFVEDIRQHRDRWTEAGVIEFVQEPGEIVFVPSGWYHQVHNLVKKFFIC